MERAIDIAQATEFVSQNRKAMMNLFQKVARTFLVVKTTFSYRTGDYSQSGNLYI